MSGLSAIRKLALAKPGESLPPQSQEDLTRLRSLGHATYWDTSKGPYPSGVAHPEQDLGTFSDSRHIFFVEVTVIDLHLREVSTWRASEYSVLSS